MKVNAKTIIKEVKADKQRSGRVNLYLNLNTYDSFKAACRTQGLDASPVVEKLMKQFVLSLQTQVKKRKVK